ncbi:hypothetical protein [Lacinutrix salivirga]
MNKNVIIGIFFGLLSTLVGSVLYILIFSSYSFAESFEQIMRFNSLNKLINLGALLNLGVFYFFLNKNQEDKAKGVLIATFIIALIFVINKLF